MYPADFDAIVAGSPGLNWVGRSTQAVWIAQATHKDEASFVGVGHKFQIWEPGRFRAELAEATEKVRALKRQLGTRVAAEGPHGARE